MGYDKERITADGGCAAREKSRLGRSGRCRLGHCEERGVSNGAGTFADKIGLVLLVIPEGLVMRDIRVTVYAAIVHCRVVQAIRVFCSVYC